MWHRYAKRTIGWLSRSFVQHVQGFARPAMGITIQDLSRVRKTNLLYFTYSYCILSLHCLFYVTINIYFCFYFNLANNVVTVLHIFLDIYHFNYTFSHAYIEAHTHKRTCMISTPQEWRQLETGAWFQGAEESVLIGTRQKNQKNVSTPISRI